jgi:hypothetical protein
MSWLAHQARRIDHLLSRLGSRRRVLVDARTAMNFAILAPVFERLQRDPRIDVVFTADRPAEVVDAARSAGVRSRIHARQAVEWRRIDLCLSADPWDPIRLRRCRRRANFFHGLAGKYDLDSPGALPIGFGEYDRVAFINADRMRRYVGSGIVAPQAAVLVGYPKVDALVNGRYDAAAIHARLQLEMHRRTAIYAPTWSPASSLNLAGEAIVASLVEAGFNVVVKLHDRSLDPSEPRFSGGVDWRERFAHIHSPGRIAFVEWADSSPLLAASDVMVTDHSSIGFEFCLLDRPLVIFDTPDLARIARINPEKIVLLRSAARVVRTAAEVGPAAEEELQHPEPLADRRRAIARDMFFEPGTATDRALAMVYELLDIPALKDTKGSKDTTATRDSTIIKARPRHSVGSFVLLACFLSAVPFACSALFASSAPSASFKLAFYNIRSGIGIQPLRGRPAPFAETVNCNPASGRVNAWGAGLVQAELVKSIKNDPLVLALGLAEAWNCGSPKNVREVLGWKADSGEMNGVAMVARHGFSGKPDFLQLDTAANKNPRDTMWIVRGAVCLDSGCGGRIDVYAAHWSGTGPQGRDTFDRQAQQSLEFMAKSAAPHVLIGDLNLFEGNAPVCGQNPDNTSLALLRRAGYVDAWPAVHGTAEGFTGMVNRQGCGSPEGYPWKRIDYAWSKDLPPISMERFGVVSPGEAAPSDHFGIVVEYGRPR